jgi:ATP-binding cassette subfamily F protein 3
MVILSASEVTKNFGERTLFEGVSFEVNDKDVIGLVGANGAGKTTLFRLIIGEMVADKGALSKNKGLKIGYMEQHICNDSTHSAIEEVLTVFDELIKIEAEIETLTNKLLTNHSHELIEKSLHLHERFNFLGGLTYKSRAKSTIIALGLSEEEIELPISVLSGGQRSKISLAKLLLSQADLLLLDEPTNHLDIAAV